MLASSLRYLIENHAGIHIYMLQTAIIKDRAKKVLMANGLSCKLALSGIALSWVLETVDDIPADTMIEVSIRSCPDHGHIFIWRTDSETDADMYELIDTKICELFEDHNQIIQEIVITREPDSLEPIPAEFDRQFYIRNHAY